MNIGIVILLGLLVAFILFAFTISYVIPVIIAMVKFLILIIVVYAIIKVIKRG